MTRIASLFSIPVFFLGLVNAWAAPDPCPPSRVLTQHKKFSQAETTLKQCVERDPNNAGLWVALSRALAAQKKWSEAQSWIDRAYKKYPHDLDIVTQRIRILAWSGKHDLAWQDVPKIERAAQMDVEKAVLIADLAYWRKQCAEATKRYDFVLGKWPGHLRARQNRAKCNIQLGNKDKAKDDINFICFKYGMNSSPCTKIKRLLGTRPKRPQKAPPQAAPSEQPAAQPAGPQAERPLKCYRLGYHLYRRNYATAETMGRQCVKNNPKDYRAWKALFKSLKAQKKLAEGQALCEQQLQIHPRSKFFALWKIRFLNAQGNIKQAWKESQQRRIESYSRNDREAAKMMARLAFKRRHYDLAIKRYTAVLERWPRDYYARYELGIVYARVRRYQEAEKEFEHLCTRGKIKTRSCWRLTRVRQKIAAGGATPGLATAPEPEPAPVPQDKLEAARLKKFEQDEKTARRRLRRGPRKVDAWVALFVAMEGQKKIDLGADEVLKAKTLLPDEPRIEVWRVRFMALQGKHKEAWKDKDGFAKIIGQDRYAALTVADMAFWIGDYPEAIRRYTFYLILYPDDLEATYNRSLAFSKTGQDKRAEKDLAKACPNAGEKSQACPVPKRVTKPKNPEMAQAKELAYKQNYDEALAILDKAIAKSPKNREYRILRVRILAWKGDYKKAWAESKDLRDVIGKDWEVAKLVADIAFWMGDCQEAVDRYTFSLILKPSDRAATLNRGTCYMKLGLLDNALIDLEKACRWHGRFSKACNLYKQAREKKGIKGPIVWTKKEEGAKDSAEEEGEEDGWGDEDDTPEDPCTAAEMYLAQQDYELAEDPLRECAELEKKNPAVLKALAKTLAALKEYDEALQWLDKAIYLDPTNNGYKLFRIRILAWKGDLEKADKELKVFGWESSEDKDLVRLACDISFWMGDYDEAVRRYTIYLIKWPGEPSVHLNRGRAYFQLGKKKRAKEDMRIACDAGLQAACSDIDAMKLSKLRYTAIAQLSYTNVEDAPLFYRDWDTATSSYVTKRGTTIDDGWSLLGAIDTRIWHTLHLGSSIRLEGRGVWDPGTNQSHLEYDLFLDVSASYEWENGWGLSGAVGFSLVQKFLPIFSIKLEPSYTFPFGLKLYFMVWRLQFEGGGATVLSPALTYGIWRLGFYFRYFLGFADDGSVGHTAMGKIMFTIFKWWGVYFGAGVGNKPEYITETQGIATDFFWSLMAGMRFNIGLRHTIMFDYIFRSEEANLGTFGAQEPNFRQHQFLLGYQFRF